MHHRRFAAVSLFTILVACTGGADSTGTTSGGGSSGGSSSGGGTCGSSDATTTLAATTDTERKTLCDCTAEIEGGYGKSFPCEGGVTVSNKKDQAACLASWTPCTNATVADLVACAQAVAEHDRCDLGATLGDSRCAYVTKCQK